MIYDVNSPTWPSISVRNTLLHMKLECVILSVNAAQWAMGSYYAWTKPQAILPERLLLDNVSATNHQSTTLTVSFKVWSECRRCLFGGERVRKAKMSVEQEVLVASGMGSEHWKWLTMCGIGSKGWQRGCQAGRWQRRGGRDRMGGKGRKNFAKSSIIYEEKWRALVGPAKGVGDKLQVGDDTKVILIWLDEICLSSTQFDLKGSTLIWSDLVFPVFHWGSTSVSITPLSLAQLPPSAPPLLRGMWAQSLTVMLANDDDSDHHHYPAHDNDQQRGR